MKKNELSEELTANKGQLKQLAEVRLLSLTLGKMLQLSHTVVSDCGKDCGSARILTAAALSEAKQEPVGRLSSNWHDKYALPYHPQYAFVVVTHFIGKCFRGHKRSHI